jgi:hypothetical protein
MRRKDLTHSALAEPAGDAVLADLFVEHGKGIVAPVIRVTVGGHSLETLACFDGTGGIVIYRNSLLANHILWSPDQTPEASKIARDFLGAECQLLRLAGVAHNTVDDVEKFLTTTQNLPISVYRSAAGEMLVRAEQASEDLLITGKTAEVLSAYIDRELVRTEDRLDMTLRRVVGL